MSVSEPNRLQLEAAERLALTWASVRVDPAVDDFDVLHVQVTSRLTEETRGGYTARATRTFEMAIDSDGEIVSGILA